MDFNLNGIYKSIFFFDVILMAVNAYFFNNIHFFKVHISTITKASELKSPPSGQRQFLATESPIKMMRNAFYFTSEAFFVLRIFKIRKIRLKF